MSLQRSIYGVETMIHACEFSAAELDHIKEEPDPDPMETTNIIVTKYADAGSVGLVDSTLEIDSKGKLIQLDLLPSSHLRTIQNKDNVTVLLNKALSKKLGKHKLEGSENKNLEEVKKKKLRACTICDKDQICTHEDGKRGNIVGGALCSKCGKNFSSNYNLKRHMTSCKLCPDDEKRPRFVCHCGRTYSQEWDMKKHKMKCKEGKKKCKRCLISDCNLLFYHKAQLITHLKREHHMDIQDPETLNFNSFEEFMVWKEREEEETYTYYSKQTGSNVTGVSINTYYVCQHDGSDRAHSSYPRKTERRNKKGRIKTGRLCWSQMNVKQFKDGMVRVIYYPSHTHPVSVSDTEHHPLPSSISEEIKRRLIEMRPEDEMDIGVVVEETELRKLSPVKKKLNGMTLRALRSLARRNRSLFRITADAVQDSEDQCYDDKTGVLLSTQTNPDDSNLMQVFVTEQDENADDPEEVQFTVDPDREEDGGRERTREELVSSCQSLLETLNGHLLSGKLSPSLVAHIEGTLQNLVTQVQQSLAALGDEPQSTQDVLYEAEPALQALPLQDTISLELSQELKAIESSPEKTIYQIVALDKDKNSNNSDSTGLLYPNTVEVVSGREFFIIAADAAQLFQSVDPNQQFDLSTSS